VWGYLKKKVLKLDLLPFDDISFIETNSTPGVEVNAVLYSLDHEEIYPFSQNSYFKKSETIDVISNNTHVHCNTQSVLLMTLTEAETDQGQVQTIDDVKAEIFQYMTH